MPRGTIIAGWLILWPLIGQGASSTYPADGQAPWTLGIDVHFLQDDTGHLEIGDMVTPTFRKLFRPLPAGEINLGNTNDAIWLRLRGDLPAGVGPYLLEIDYGLLDEVTFYQREPSQPEAWQIQRAGDRLPFSLRSLEHPNPVFEWAATETDPETAYLRIQSAGALIMPLRLWNEDAFWRFNVDAQLWFGFYYAFLAAMAIYNLFLFIAIRDAAYLYYVGYLAGFVLFQAALQGHAAMYLWPEWPAWGNLAAVVCAAISGASGLMFVRHIADTPRMVPGLDRPLLVLVWLTLAVLPVVWLDYGLGVRMLVPVALAVVLFIPWPVVLSYLRGHKPVRFAVLGYAAILPGAALLVLRNLDIVPVNFWTTHGVQIGTAADAMLLSFALADRINLLRDERDRARAQLLHTEREALATQKDFSKRLLQAQDAERRRLARELHDGLGQVLATVSNHLRRWIRQGHKPRVEELSDLADRTKDMVSDLRSISHNLHPHQLDRLGLESALQSVIEQMEGAYGLHIERQIDPVEALISDTGKLHVYRIAQEALTNVARHANATRVSVRLAQERDHVLLEISDDGVGLSRNRSDTGLGLAGMRERARVIGAVLEIHSRKAGTTVLLQVPVSTGGA